jgi:DNA-binding NarL/FixJ family response regulator
LIRGNSHRQIAQLLGLDVKTVSAHKRNAMVKLGFSRTSDLYYWMKNGGLAQEIRELI